MKNCMQTSAIYISYEKGQCEQGKLWIMKYFEVLHVKGDTDELECVWS